MKKLFIIFFLAIMIFQFASAEVVNKIVARVNEEIITEYELNEAVNFYLAQMKNPPSNIDEVKEKVLESLIEDKLVMKDAELSGLTEQIDEDLLSMNVEMAIDNIRAQYPNEEAFQRALKMAGMSLAELRENYTRQIKESEFANILIEKKVKSKINIEKEEMLEYYEKHKEEFVKAVGKVELSQIMIKGTRKGAFGIAQGLKNRINSPDDFHNLASEISDDELTKKDSGRLGSININQLNKKISSQVSRTPEGQVTDVIEIGGNYFLFFVDKKHSEEKKSFEEAFEEVKARLYAKKVEKVYNQYIEELKEESYIEIKL